MANRQKGEMSFDADGKTYVLCFSSNALCELEDAIGVGVVRLGELLSNVETLKLKDVRAVLWAGLTDHQKGIDVKSVGRIIDTIGIARAVEIISSGMSLAFPSEEADSPREPGQ